jgi:hypothetical protein
MPIVGKLFAFKEHRDTEVYAEPVEVRKQNKKNPRNFCYEDSHYSCSVDPEASSE